MDLTSILSNLQPDAIQPRLDAELQKHPQIAAYVEWVRYVPEGADPPEDATHILSLESCRGAKPGVYLAIKAKGLWPVLIDSVLGLV